MSQLHQITVNLPQRLTLAKPREVFQWVALKGQPFEGSVLGVNPPAVSVSQQGLTTLSLEIFQRPRVLAILVQAFSHGLSRDVAWDLDGVPHEDLGCYRAAARVYKRGVSTINDPVSDDADRRSSQSHKSYNVTFLNRASDCLAGAQANDLVILDAQVAEFWADKLSRSAKIIRFSESEKSLRAFAKILAMLRIHASQAAGKNFDVYVVGGGVAGDMVGFACGLLGLDFHYVPSTVLAMVDSSVGGKVGVNFEPWGKNQIGLFHQPASVRICSEWLSTLPDREVRNGLAEAFKHAILSGDEDLWTEVKSACQFGFKKITSDLLLKLVQFKCSVVARDPEEQGERAVLNFGHTLGHAIETLALKQGVVAPHGECVAIGMVHALRLSQKHLGMHADPFIDDLIQSDIIGSPAIRQLFGGSSSLIPRHEEILGLMTADKKSKTDGKIRFVLLEKPGVVARDVDGGWTKPFDTHQALQDVAETVILVSKQLA